MAFFSKDKLKPRTIEVDPTTVDANSDQIRARLDRIRNNYDRLREVFTELESQIESDERLKAIDETLDDRVLESAVSKKPKRRWRKASAASDKRRTRSSGVRGSGKPGKPR